MRVLVPLLLPRCPCLPPCLPPYLPPCLPPCLPSCLPARRDALAAARMLGRVLALPTLWCWCDYDESPDILETCRIK